ncbi:MAG: hypothetical protein QN193_05685 [Armatimonadota bacterium]|nr:hypothetical protein [Armatimonadota bacterium]MDR7443984.1 hypothetical protein [Armatimonadota bacterium]MDR7570082.1 hypothetical protein [Armatimonadota bacterium]MDR7615413.1 hypothetical protein [Armatimonadota bacterium]
MTWEAWLGVAAFLVLFTLWSFLPSRFLRRTRGTAAETQANVPPAPPPAPPARASWNWAGAGVELRLLRNPAFGHGADPRTVPRYFYTVRLGGDGEARLPVYWDPRPVASDPLVREVYRVRVAGRSLEAGNLHLLGEEVRAAVGRLVAAGGLPRFWLVNGTSAVPVYRAGEVYVAPTDGPRLWGTDLAQLRARYAHYVASCNGGECGPVTVALLSPQDLDVHLPEAILVGPALWIPVFATEGQMVAFGPGTTTWSAPQEPAGILPLWELVACELTASGRLTMPAALWAMELSETCCRGLLKAGEPTGLMLRFTRFTGQGVSRTALPVHRWRHLYFASCQEGACLHIAPDSETLRESLSAHLTETGLVRGVQDVALEEGNGPELGDGVRTGVPRLSLVASNA